MTLQVKFLLLVGALLLAVVGSIAAAWYTMHQVHREVASHFESVATVLEHLGHIKRSAERTAVAIDIGNGHASPGQIGTRGTDDKLPPRAATEAEREELRAAASIAAQRVEALERNDWYRSRVGLSTWLNLRRRLATALDGARAWADEGDEVRRVASRRDCYELHELIEKTELQILADANLAVGFSSDYANRLGWFLASVVLAAALVSVLAVVLLRRWVQRPVAQLREAAARIASGDFEHRVAVETGDEIGQLMSEVNHMAGMVDQLQHAAVERERLAAVGQMVRRIVHNVRNPLAGIRGLAEVTRLDMAAGSEGRESLDLIVTTVDTFERWLTELLETTRPLEVTPVPTALRPWIEGVVATHEPAARARGVHLEADLDQGPVEAVFDPRHLEHALAAVLANAIDSSPDKGTVFVRVTLVNDGDWVEISVSDQGPGVPEDLRDRIFEPHFTTKAKGTGIGLAIARQILRSHGGSITLDPPANSGSQPRGACFRVRIPREARIRTVGVVAEHSHQSG